ncbi:molybdenum cofactor biosynthesis protein MoeB [Fulvitalea axinellae]|uniref:Molybdopterin-synthase adenylyltransferase n=1 Tax=Fulvitalea axinellae TaxID=1182444 RepID=A0AAU9CBH8_9BACT|nr:molybdenum cofactor biosynthesis protein MoeB [Fulvitalea axinellae]
MSRYSRHTMLPEIGPEGQNKLSEAKVLVIGAGGLGCPILQYLCAAGVGTVGIVDHDTVDESNLQRQVLYGSGSLGQNKAMAAKERLTDLNGTIRINAYPEKLTVDNATLFFSHYDIVIDGTDNFATRYLINDVSVLTGKPLVYGAIYKFEGQVAVFNHDGGPSYRCLFPEPPSRGAVPNCSDIGVLGVLPGIIGSMQANEVLKLILGIGSTLSGKLLCYNALTNQSVTMKVQRTDLAEKERVSLGDHSSETMESCSFDVPTVTLDQAIEMSDVLFVDVREPYELPAVSGLDHISIPLRELEMNSGEIETGKTIVFFCQSGARSQEAVTLSHKLGIGDCYSLKEGATELNEILAEEIN